MIQEYTVGATGYGYWLGKVGKAAVAKLNAEGGIAGRKVEVIDYDTKVNPAWSASMFRKLILEDKVDMIMGSVHSGVQMACFPLAQQFKVPYFGGGAMTAGFTGKDAIPYYIRIHTHALMRLRQVGSGPLIIWVKNRLFWLQIMNGSLLGGGIW